VTIITGSFLRCTGVIDSGVFTETDGLLGVHSGLAEDAIARLAPMVE